MSVSNLAKQNFENSFTANGDTVCNGSDSYQFISVNGMYPIRPTEVRAFIVDINTWHRRFGHINTTQISKTFKDHDIEFEKTPMLVSPHCAIGKLKLKIFPASKEKPKEVGELVCFQRKAEPFHDVQPYE